jgi:hypothetical protein
VAESISSGGSAEAAVTESLNLTESWSVLRGVSEGITEFVSVADAMTLRQALSDAITERLSIRVGFSTPEADYVGWTMNANTSAVSMYESFTFNSFARVGGKHYGATAEGIFEITGTADSGRPIDASVLLPNTDFGSANLKRVARAYLGIRAGGGIQLRLVTGDGESNVYELDRENGVIREARVEFGRGLRSRYWQFEVRNVDGADFVLDEIELFLSTTTRRI